MRAPLTYRPPRPWCCDRSHGHNTHTQYITHNRQVYLWGVESRTVLCKHSTSFVVQSARWHHSACLLYLAASSSHMPTASRVDGNCNGNGNGNGCGTTDGQQQYMHMFVDWPCLVASSRTTDGVGTGVQLSLKARWATLNGVSRGSAMEAGQAAEMGVDVQGRPDDHTGRLFPSTGSTTDDAGLLMRGSVQASKLEVLELVESLQGGGASESLFGAGEGKTPLSPSLDQHQHQQFFPPPPSSSSSSSSSPSASAALLCPLGMGEEEVEVSGALLATGADTNTTTTPTSPPHIP